MRSRSLPISFSHFVISLFHATYNVASSWEAVVTISTYSSLQTVNRMIILLHKTCVAFMSRIFTYTPYTPYTPYTYTPYTLLFAPTLYLHLTLLYNIKTVKSAINPLLHDYIFIPRCACASEVVCLCVCVECVDTLQCVSV